MAAHEKTYGPCWCASADKCPHPIASKYPVQEEELEKIIDKILKQFDRRSIKQYLKEQTASKGQSMALKDGGKLKEVRLCFGFFTEPTYCLLIRDRSYNRLLCIPSNQTFLNNH